MLKGAVCGSSTAVLALDVLYFQLQINIQCFQKMLKTLQLWCCLCSLQAVAPLLIAFIQLLFFDILILHNLVIYFNY